MFKATYIFNFTKKFRQCRDGDTKEIFVWIKFKEIVHSLCPINYDFCKFFSNVFDFYCSFSKRRLVDFVTASVLTKLPIEKAIAKPQKCSIANNETLLWTFAWHFLKIFLKFKKELVFSFKASRNLRSKSYQLVGVSYVLWC